MATDPSEFVSIFSPGGTRLTLPPASPAGSEAGGVGSAQSSQTPAQQGAAGSVVQKILGGPSGSIGSVGGGSDTAGSKTSATEPVTPAPVSPARIGDGPGEQRTGAQSPPVMMSPEMLKTILAESMAMGMQIAGASAEKQAKEQTTPGGSLSESALSGASAGTPRLHAARTLDYLLEGYLKKADKMDFKAGLPSPELQLQDRLQATVTYCTNIRAEMRVNGMAHWFELDPAVTSGLELEDALTLTLNGKHVGKHGLRMHYVNDHKQAVSVQLAFKLQSAVVACAALAEDIKSVAVTTPGVRSLCYNLIGR